MSCTYTNTRGTFDFAAVENKIIVDRHPDENGGGWKKYMPVVQDDEYAIKEQKTQLRAHGGAPGLYAFMEKSVRIDDCFICIVNKIIEVVGERGKDACSI